MSNEEKIPSAFINQVREMGYRSSTVDHAYDATHSTDPQKLLDWILSHENELKDINDDQIDLAQLVIDEVVELGFPRASAKTAQDQTNSNDTQTLVDWILNHDQDEQYPLPTTTTTTADKRQQQDLDTTSKNKGESKLLHDLLKLGFNTDDIQKCFNALYENENKKSWIFSRKNDLTVSQCIDWLIDSSRQKAELKAKEIDQSKKQLRIPSPIKLNGIGGKASDASLPASNSKLKEIHLASRHRNNDDNQQESPKLTHEEARMFSICDNLKKQTWTLDNVDQLNLIQKHIQIVSKIIDEDHNKVQRYNDEDDGTSDKETSVYDPMQQRRSTTTKPKTNAANSGIVTLADLRARDYGYEQQQKKLDLPPKLIYESGAVHEINWEPSIKTDFDRIAIQFESIQNESYQNLTRRLLNECNIGNDNNLAKVRAIFVWITSHIRYDIRTSDRDNSKDKNDQDMDELCAMILQTSTCVCVGYAVLLKRMCHSVNIQVDYVVGYTKLTKAYVHDLKTVDEINKFARHAWNIIHLNGQTYFTDPTWSAAHWSGPPYPKLKSSFTNTYFLVLPRYSIYQFFPENTQHQQLDRPWSIVDFTNEPCFYPHYFSSQFTLENDKRDWFFYRLPVDPQQRTKTFCITTRKCNRNSRYHLAIFGTMYWARDLKQFTSEYIDRLDNTNHSYRLPSANFQEINLNLADPHLSNKRSLFVAELSDIPIYPSQLDVTQIQFGLLRIYATDQLTGRGETIFECIFEF
ncbi:unnamed protein product [Didymodactylos carnosus]|uniref:UBA domain-containing protein n=1 Tax=Didymodactylos carnosus TaxID=1234261 RepID=A0A815CHM5_9BILA|nr:unnamed protein product [Didymodactylos carnosus]CAF1280455.1 unnamed protein product [Didymodactylos carnosus]CAF3891877.1 unnamed protein product [Didymodactylos carnosus]CAF4075395.1 unnamed protein product [Didymodactylos carnosus]